MRIYEKTYFIDHITICILDPTAADLRVSVVGESEELRLKFYPFSSKLLVMKETQSDFVLSF